MQVPEAVSERVSLRRVLRMTMHHTRRFNVWGARASNNRQGSPNSNHDPDAKHVMPPLFAFPHIRDVSADDLATCDTFFRANMLPCCLLYLDRVDAGGSAVGSHRCGPDPLLPAAVTWWVGALRNCYLLGGTKYR